MAVPGGQIGVNGSGTEAVADKDSRTWAMLAHLATFSAFLTGIGSIVGPLIVWLVKKDQSPFVDEHGKEALNFNISIAIYMIGAGILTIILIGFLVMLAVGIFWAVMSVIAAMKANNGEHYRYPLTIRLIK